MAFFFSEELPGRHHFGEVWPTGMGAKHQRPTSCPYLLPKSRASSGQKRRMHRDKMRRQQNGNGELAVQREGEGEET